MAALLSVLQRYSVAYAADKRMRWLRKEKTAVSSYRPETAGEIMNQEHKDLLIAAAKAAGIDGVFRVNGYRQIYGISKQMDDELWNPITNLSDRYDLARRCGLAISWGLGKIMCDAKSGFRTFNFTPNDDESEALAILRAAVASKEIK